LVSARVDDVDSVFKVRAAQQHLGGSLVDMVRATRISKPS